MFDSPWLTSTLGQKAKFRRGLSYDLGTLSDSAHGARPYLNMKSFLKDGGYNTLGLKYFSGAVSKDDVLGDNCLVIANTDVTRDGDIIGAPALVPTSLAGFEVVCSHHVTALRLCDGCDARFLYHLLRLPRYRSAFRQHARGTTVLMLDARSIEDIAFDHPSDVWEQRRIADVLDVLDITIRQTEAIIEKLKHVKQGLLHDLLTCGIAANGELRPPQSQAPHLYRDSPLGWIPKVWHTLQLGDLIKDHQSGVYKNRLLYGAGANIVGVADLFRHDSIDGQEFRRVATSSAERTRFRLSAGDLVYAESSLVLDGIAKTIAVSEGGAGTLFAWHTRRLTPDSSTVNPFYLALALGAPACRRYVISRATQTALTGIPVAEYLTTPVPVPPVDEQREIIDRMNAVDSRRHTELQFATKLRTQKTGLMDDLLTGRVRVTPLLEKAISA